MTKQAEHTPTPWRMKMTSADWLKILDAKGQAVCIPATKEIGDHIIAVGNAHEELVKELKSAVAHIEHMAAFITKQNAGYSFESLGEDMPGMKAALAKAEGR